MEEYKTVEESNLLGTKVEFIDKVYNPVSKSSRKCILSIIALILFIIVLIGSILVAGGVGGVSVSVLGLIAYCLTNIDSREVDLYVLSLAIFEVNSEGIILSHQSVDYQDKRGKRNEVNSISWDSVTGLVFREELNSFCIEGKGKQVVTWMDSKRKNRSPRTRNITEIVLYVPYNMKQEFVSMIESYYPNIQYIQ